MAGHYQESCGVLGQHFLPLNRWSSLGAGLVKCWALGLRGARALCLPPQVNNVVGALMPVSHRRVVVARGKSWGWASVPPMSFPLVRSRSSRTAVSC